MLVSNTGIAGGSGANIFKRATRSLTLKIRSFAGDREGNIVFLFAFMSTLLFLFAGGAVDFSRWNAVRADMIESMDAAGLAMAQIDALNGPEIKDLTAEERTLYLKEQGRKFFNENFKHASLVEDLSVDFDISTSRITPKATGRMKTLFLGIGQKLLTGDGHGSLSYLNLSSETEIVRRDDGNIEVSLVLDITGSMAGQRVTDLKAAAKEFVDIVVRDDQSEWYSKVALAPYSMAVNAGAYASQIRGSIPAPIAITNVQGKIGTAKGINNVETLNPVKITTASNHGFSNGDTVWITGVQRSGGSGSCRLECQINNKAYTVSNATSTTFTLQGVNGTSWSGNYSSSSTDFTTKCAATNCEVLVTAPSHGFSTNDYVHINGVVGMSRIDGDSSKTQINNNVTNSGYGDDYWQITKVDNNNFRLQSSVGPDYNDYTSGGSAYCTANGCEYFRFQNANGSYRAMKVSSCVSERTGAQAYTDTAPSSSHFGYVYAASGNPCPAPTISPLSSDKVVLKNDIESLQAGGSTGGHLGVAWGWYVLSPNFGYLFPSASVPAPYDDEETTKVTVLMTDGEYNSSYCSGVISGVTSTNGSGSKADQINCTAPNGHAYAQAEALCDAMKDAGVIVYTVGFMVIDTQSAKDLMNNCASGPEYVFFAASGEELKDIYRNIGSEITKLHIGK